MSFVYIIYSQQADRFYIGFTTILFEQRLANHNVKYYENKFTAFTNDWEEFLIIQCDSNKQARLIESHIKRMKSKSYIMNLKKYPEMITKLKDKYKNS